MAQHIETENPWEKAYFEQIHDAAIGRLFQGLLHNLNGDIQAFSMQVELLTMMFGQANEILQKLHDLSAGEASKENAIKLQEIIGRRVNATEEMQGKITSCQDILKRALFLPDFRVDVGDAVYSVNSAIHNEINFLCADSFFKHKVTKELKLSDDMPPLQKNPAYFHQILFAIITNAIESMSDFSEEPKLLIETACREDIVEIAIHDNGCGVSEKDVAQIYEPFFTTKENHLGVGLYFVEKILNSVGGKISCESKSGETCFFLSIPKDRI